MRLAPPQSLERTLHVLKALSPLLSQTKAAMACASRQRGSLMPRAQFCFFSLRSRSFIHQRSSGSQRNGEIGMLVLIIHSFLSGISQANFAILPTSSKHKALSPRPDCLAVSSPKRSYITAPLLQTQAVPQACPHLLSPPPPLLQSKFASFLFHDFRGKDDHVLQMTSHHYSQVSLFPCKNT